MHISFKIIILSGLLTSCSIGQVAAIDTSKPYIADSTTLLQSIGKTSAKIALGTLKVGAQYVGAIFIGSATAGIIHQPVLAGIGWTAGSSIAVCIIGDLSEERYRYWWVFGAGAAGAIIFIPDMTEGGLGAAFSVAAAMITSTTFEIITFYLTERDIPIKAEFEVKPSPLTMNARAPTASNPIPTFHVQIYF